MLAVSGNQTYAIYLYADGLIQWTTSDSQGGVNGLGGNWPPVAGYSAGDGIRNTSFMVPGSLTNDIIKIASTSNVHVPGKWVLRLHEDDPALLCSDNEFCKECIDKSNNIFQTRESRKPDNLESQGPWAVATCTFPSALLHHVCVFADDTFNEQS